MSWSHLTLVLSLELAGTAFAQPELPPPPPPFTTMPRPELRITLDEQSLLETGFISSGQQLGGGLMEMFFGFGIGQAVQGRWGDTGWIFTLGDGASTVAFTVGLFRVIGCVDRSSSTCHGGSGAELMALGALGSAVFRVWGTVDAFHGPTVHNQRLRDLRTRLGFPMYTRVMPYVAPHGGEGVVGGVSWRF